MTASKIVAAAASGVAVGSGVDVDELFNTEMYRGTSAVNVIDTGLAMGNSNDGGSVRFAGRNSNWLNVPASSDFGFGTGNFTIELFFFLNEKFNYNNLIDFRTTNESNNLAAIYVDNTPNISFFIGGVGAVISSSVNVGQWYHVAVSKSGTSTKMFLNGTQVGGTYTDNTNYATPTTTWSIGAAANQSNYESNAFISNVRVAKGTAIYNSNFTAPTSALTDVTATVLLTCQGDTPFVDNSSSGHTLTLNNYPRASKFGPFTGSSGEGGMVWIKSNQASRDHCIFDTERGVYKFLRPNDTSVETSQNTTITSFNTSGFTIGVDNTDLINKSYASNADRMSAWSWRKSEKWFDVVTYTGDGTTFRDIAHNLGSVPGHIMIKKRLGGSNTGWVNWHRTFSDYDNVFLSGSSAKYNDGSNNSLFGQASNMTSTHFELGGNGNISYINENGSTYVAYLFAHNNNDGEFGPNSDQDIIKCGSYTATSDTSRQIDLGFEAQWLMIKNISNTFNWVILDATRVWRRPNAQNNDSDVFYANTNDAETGLIRCFPTPTGFGFEQESNGYVNSNGNEYIYIAIRRGPLSTPTSSNDVFALGTRQGGPPRAYAPFVADMNIRRNDIHTGSNASIETRVTESQLYPGTTGAEANLSNFFQQTNGVNGSSGSAETTDIYHMWKRAPGFFDVTTDIGTGSAHTITHNLGVVPEMMWRKHRTSTSDDWFVYHKGLNDGTNPYTHYIRLNATNAQADDSGGRWHAAPTASVFSVGSSSSTNQNTGDYITWLFATVDGVSKVGSYNGNGGTQNIDCGFSNGAALIIIKNYTDSEGWKLHSIERGIVAGNDPFTDLNNNNAENTSFDVIDPHPSGFTVNNFNGWNGSGAKYIFYAVADD